jgi:DNA replication protein DnaC
MPRRRYEFMKYVVRASEEAKAAKIQRKQAEAIKAAQLQSDLNEFHGPFKTVEEMNAYLDGIDWEDED